MNVLDALKKIFVNPVTTTINALWVNVRGDMTRMREKRQERIRKRDGRQLADAIGGTARWQAFSGDCPMYEPVHANTKSEARGRIKVMHGFPRRLPIWMKVRKVA